MRYITKLLITPLAVIYLKIETTKWKCQNNYYTVHTELSGFVR